MFFLGVLPYVPFRHTSTPLPPLIAEWGVPIARSDLLCSPITYHMSDQFPSVIEAVEQQRVASAKRNGFSFFPVRESENCPAFVYTCGMAQHGLPEFLCFATPDMCRGTLAMLSQLCPHMIEGLTRFDRVTLVRGLLARGITVRDPEIHYSPELLRGDDLRYAYDGCGRTIVRSEFSCSLNHSHDLQQPQQPVVAGCT